MVGVVVAEGEVEVDSFSRRGGRAPIERRAVWSVCTAAGRGWMACLRLALKGRVLGGE